MLVSSQANEPGQSGDNSGMAFGTRTAVQVGELDADRDDGLWVTQEAEPSLLFWRRR